MYKVHLNDAVSGGREKQLTPIISIGTDTGTAFHITVSHLIRGCDGTQHTPGHCHQDGNNANHDGQNDVKHQGCNHLTGEQ